HIQDLAFLSEISRKDSRTYLDTLDGMDPFSSALVALRVLKHHAVPLDERTLTWLREEGALPADIAPADAQAFLEKIVPPAHAEATFTALRRQAAERTAKA